MNGDAMNDVTMRLPRWHGYLGLGCAVFCLGVALPGVTRDQKGVELVVALVVVSLIAMLALFLAAYAFRTQLTLRDDAVRIDSLGGRRTIPWISIASIGDSRRGGLVLHIKEGERFSIIPHFSNIYRLIELADAHGVPRPRDVEKHA